VPLSLLATPGCSAILANAVKREQVERRTFEVPAAPRVVVETFNGDIRVEAASEGKVEATVTKLGAGANEEAAAAHLEQVKVDFIQESEAIRVVVTRPRRQGLRFAGDSEAGVALKVPPGSSLKLTTDNGGIVIEGVVGDVVARTSNGQIEMDGARGKLELETRNGAVRVEASGATVAARSNNGDVIFLGTLGKGAHILHTNNGNVRVGVPAAEPFRFTARTSNGSVTSGFPDLMTTDGKPGGNRWAAANGTGVDGADLQLETNNGRIVVEPLSPAEAPGPR
jgi:DUF4097 and DUF4098 domain-containing protein YvlB